MFKNYKQFTIKSLIFLIGFFIFIFFLQSFIFFTIRNISTGEFGVLNKINNGDISTDIIISGQSQGLKGIKPIILEKELGLTSYNICADGTTLGIQLPKLKWYLNKNKSPKIIIQIVSKTNGLISKQIFQPYKYLYYISDDSLYNGLRKIEPDFWIHKYLYPTNLLYFNFDFYVSLFQELYLSLTKRDFLEKGFYADRSKWSGNIKLLQQKRANGIKAALTNDYKEYIEELINICKVKNIILLFVVLPNYHEYSALIDNSYKLTQYYEQIASQKGVYLFDYFENDIAKDTRYFYNFTHLNADGALKISQLLANDIKDIVFNSGSDSLMNSKLTQKK